MDGLVGHYPTHWLVWASLRISGGFHHWLVSATLLTFVGIGSLANDIKLPRPTCSGTNSVEFRPYWLSPKRLPVSTGYHRRRTVCLLPLSISDHFLLPLLGIRATYACRLCPFAGGMPGRSSATVYTVYVLFRPVIQLRLPGTCKLNSPKKNPAARVFGNIRVITSDPRIRVRIHRDPNPRISDPIKRGSNGKPHRGFIGRSRRSRQTSSLALFEPVTPSQKRADPYVKQQEYAAKFRGEVPRADPVPIPSTSLKMDRQATPRYKNAACRSYGVRMTGIGARTRDNT